MKQFIIENDKLSQNETDHLGWPHSFIEEGMLNTLPEDYDGWFCFTRMDFSIGDWAVISGLPEALKKKYPKIKVAFPSRKWFIELLGPILNRWNYSKHHNAIDNFDIIFKNNPHIDYLFDPGEIKQIFTDHDRCWFAPDSNLPIVEQVLLRFGFTIDDLNKIDSRPSLYFTQEEADAAKYVTGKEKYGCLLLSSRIEKLKGRWDDKNLLKEARKFKDTPVYYYSDFDLEGTEWDEIFPVRYNFARMGLTIREQLCIKARAEFNISYQAGISDAVAKTTESIVLCPYKSPRANTVRNVKYVFVDKDLELIFDKI